MKSALATVVVSSLVNLGSSVSCSSNSIGIDWTGSSGSNSGAASFQSASTSSDCGQTTCSAAAYDIDYTLTVEDFLGFPNWDWDLSLSFSVDSEFCGDDAVCDILAGGTDACRAINYDFIQWYPTSCNEATDYDATTAEFNITYKYACCTTDNCNDNFDYSTCEYNEDLGNYVSELYECWNGVRRDLMEYLVCDDSGNTIYEFEGSCRDSGSWVDDTDCTYVLTCSDTWQTILTNFGECACSAATDNNYPGLVISEIMETQWNTYCPGINLTCSADGDLELFLQRYYLVWTFYVDLAVDLVTDEVRQNIIQAIAEAANCDESLVTITSEVDGDTTGVTGRRRLGEGTTFSVSIETETEEDAGAMGSNLDSNGEQSLSDAGYNSTAGTTMVTDTNEDVAAESGASNVFISYALAFVSVAVIAEMIKL